jgi:hypothetical protein
LAAWPQALFSKISICEILLYYAATGYQFKVDSVAPAKVSAQGDRAKPK